ncbi:MAG: hypothetical protein ABUT39_18665 [Acidobacteriota bacterium]
MRTLVSALGLVSWMAVSAAAQAASQGQELFRFGREGIGPAQMSDVERIAVEPQGSIYVADTDLDRIQRFDRNGTLQSLAYFDGRIESLAFDRGSLYVVVGEKLFRYDPETWKLLGEVQRPGRYKFLSVAPRKGGGVLAIGEGGRTEITFIDEGKVVQAFDEPALRYLGTDPPSLLDDGKGFFYVAENYNNSIHKIANDGRYISHFGSDGDEPGQFHDDIVGLAIDSQDRIWASDSNGFNLFATDGRFLGGYDEMPAEGIAADGDEIHAAAGESVVRYALTDGGEGDEPAPKTVGELWKTAPKQDRGRRMPDREPRFGTAVDRGGSVYTVSEGRLLRYSADGKLLGEVKHPDGAGFFHVAPRPDHGVVASWRNAQRDDLVLVGGDGSIETLYKNAVSGAVGAPAGDTLVAMDGRRKLYAAVPKLHIVCIFNEKGVYENRFGSEGDEPGQLSGRLAGIVVDGQERVWVADGKRISIFQSEDARFLRRLERAAETLAITDDDRVLAATGKEVSELHGDW